MFSDRAADKTCRLRIDVFEEVHLPTTSSLKTILERVQGWCVGVFLGQTVPSGCDPLRKELETCVADLSFDLFPAESSSSSVYFWSAKKTASKKTLLCSSVTSVLYLRSSRDHSPD